MKVELNAKGKKFALVVSRFNEAVSGRLVEGARDELVKHGAAPEDIRVFWVPGAFEIPLLLSRLADTGKYHALVALGAIIRGETPHFDFVATEASKGIARVMLEKGIPVGFGLITADTLEQAIDRAGGKLGNKGRMAALSALEMACILESLGEEAHL